MAIDLKYGRVTLDRFLAWQAEHPDQVRVPTSENSRSWMD